MVKTCNWKKEYCGFGRDLENIAGLGKMWDVDWTGGCYGKNFTYFEVKRYKSAENI